MNMIPRVCALPSQFASLFLLFLVFRHSLMIDMTELHKEQKVDEVKSHIRASLSPPNRGVDIQIEAHLSNVFISWCSTVVRPGGDVHWETPPEAGVAVAALHPGEAGAGGSPPR